MSEPRIPIDWKKVDFLLESGCNGVQVASNLGVHPDTLYDRAERDFGTTFSAYAAQKRSKGDANILAKQYEKAMKGDTTMIVWLGKNRLGQRDRPPEDEHLPNKKELNELIASIKEGFQAKKEELKEKILDKEDV